MNHYETLGVKKEATKSEIKKAFRELANKHHPDKGGDAEKFKKINEAYSILSDDDKRREYDTGRSQSSWNPFNGFDMGDFFNMHFNGGTRHRASMARQGVDIKAQVVLTIYEMLTGCIKEVELTYTDDCEVCKGTGAEEKETCNNCNGSGTVSQHFTNGLGTQIRTGPCPKCKGTGYIIKVPCPSCEFGRVLKHRKVNVTIPKELGWSATLRIAGEGGKGFNGGPNGNLYVEVTTKVPDISKMSENELNMLKRL